MRGTLRQGWRSAALAVLALLALQPLPAFAATSEAQVKAAYVYKLASFVRWPDDTPAGGDFTLCVNGRRDVATALQQLVRGQRIAGQPVSVVQLDAAGQARSCRVLFVGRGSAAATGMLAATETAPVLTICDRNNGSRGCVIEFVMQSGKVRFTVDRPRADRRRLELSAKLMDVAVGAP